MTSPLLNLSVMALITGLAAWLFRPNSGAFWRWQRARQVTRRVLMEDALKHIHDCEHQRRAPTVQSIAGAAKGTMDEVAELLAEMQAHDLISFAGDRINLTPQGHDYALHIIRAHRLWERYLADETGVAAVDWHSQSERREHELTPAQADALARELGHPRFDPHGDPIPTATGDLVPAAEQYNLSNFPPNQPGRIAHLEDEPETVYAQLVAEGLYVGMAVLVAETTPHRVRFWADGDERLLAPMLAANVSVAPVRTGEGMDAAPFETLNELKVGEAAEVIGLSPQCRGAERRRFLDLGILPGTIIRAELVSPSGDPTAYRIRGALIGLRREQAALIQVALEAAPESARAPG